MWQFPGQVCGFLRRHRRKFIFAGVLVGGVIGTVKYAQYKVKDWMEKEEQKYLEELKKQQHFEKTQIHCFAIAQAVVKTLEADILTLIDTEQITNSLKIEKNPEKKLELWNELKVTVFTKVATCLYVLTLSVVIIRIQLNHLAAKVYSVTSKKQGDHIDDVTQKWFLSLSHEFIAKNSLEYITGEMKKISNDLTESMPLQCRMRGADVEAILKSTHDRINHHTKLQFCTKITSDQCSILDLLVPTDAEYGIKKLLVDEMWDIFDSDDCMKAFTSCIFKSFHDFCQVIDTAITDAVGSTNKVQDTELEMIGSHVPDSSFLLLAKVLPILNSQVYAMTSDGFVRKILANETLTKFSANVFESFTQE